MFLAHRLRRLLLHANPFGGIVDNYRQVFIFKLLVEKVAQLRLRSNRMDTHRQSLAGKNRPPNLRLRSFVGTYGVKRNIDEHGLTSLQQHRLVTSLLP